MSKRKQKNQQPSATDNKALASHIESVDGPASEQAPAEKVVVARTMREINSALDGLTDADKAALAAIQVAANVQAGTAGIYRTADGKGTTKDRKLAKLSVSGKPIPVYTPTRGAVTVEGIAVSATHADETIQLRGRYAQGWGQLVIARCKAYVEKHGAAKFTIAERDKLVNQSDVPSAWRPRYNKDLSPASQYARHIEVMREFGILTSN